MDLVCLNWFCFPHWICNVTWQGYSFPLPSSPSSSITSQACSLLHSHHFNSSVTCQGWGRLHFRHYNSSNTSYGCSLLHFHHLTCSLTSQECSLFHLHHFIRSITSQGCNYFFFDPITPSIPPPPKVVVFLISTISSNQSPQSLSLCWLPLTSCDITSQGYSLPYLMLFCYIICERSNPLPLSTLPAIS